MIGYELRDPLMDILVKLMNFTGKQKNYASFTMCKLNLIILYKSGIRHKYSFIQQRDDEVGSLRIYITSSTSYSCNTVEFRFKPRHARQVKTSYLRRKQFQVVLRLFGCPEHNKNAYDSASEHHLLINIPLELYKNHRWVILILDWSNLKQDYIASVEISSSTEFVRKKKIVTQKF